MHSCEISDPNAALANDLTRKKRRMSERERDDNISQGKFSSIRISIPLLAILFRCRSFLFFLFFFYSPLRFERTRKCEEGEKKEKKKERRNYVVTARGKEEKRGEERKNW